VLKALVFIAFSVDSPLTSYDEVDLPSSSFKEVKTLSPTVWISPNTKKKGISSEKGTRPEVSVDSRTPNGSAPLFSEDEQLFNQIYPFLVWQAIYA
jgi:hypothetical protein